VSRTAPVKRGISAASSEPSGLAEGLPIRNAWNHPPRLIELATLGSQRQGDLRGKAHLEPLPCPRGQEGLPRFAPRPRKMAGLLSILSY
jgi:hypothetical protein